MTNAHYSGVAKTGVLRKSTECRGEVSSREFEGRGVRDAGVDISGRIYGGG